MNRFASLYVQPMKGTRQITAILNPQASSGRTRGREKKVRAALNAAGLGDQIIRTKHQGHAVEIARSAAVESDLVIAVGGDGTVNEVARGIIESGCQPAFGIIPSGTGNDFARFIGMSMDIGRAVSQIGSGVITRVDAGRVIWKEQKESLTQLVERQSYFVNTLGAGFDGHAAFLAPKYKHLPFQTGYLTAILVALRTWVSSGATIWNDSTGPTAIFSGRLFFVTVGNARDSAGGYRINPRASIADGLLDACIVSDVSIWRAIRLLPMARRGRHLTQPEVAYRQLSRMRIESDLSLPVHADGELLSECARSIRVQALPGALRVCVPRASVGPIRNLSRRNGDG